MWENFDHATDPKSKALASRYKTNNTLVQISSTRDKYPQTKPSVTLIMSSTTNRSARTNRNGELPSATTSTRIKNQNQYPPIQTYRAPPYQITGKNAGAVWAEVE